MIVSEMLKTILNKVENLLPNWMSEKATRYFFIGIAVLVYTVLYANEVQFERIINILDILVWPSIVLFSVIFFRQIFTYLFFSMKRFNFFGASGELKGVEEVIEEEVQRTIQQEKEVQTRNETIKKLEKKLKIEGQSQKQILSVTEQVMGLYKEQSEEVNRLKKLLSQTTNTSLLSKVLEERVKKEEKNIDNNQHTNASSK